MGLARWVRLVASPSSRRRKTSGSRGDSCRRGVRVRGLDRGRGSHKLVLVVVVVGVTARCSCSDKSRVRVGVTCAEERRRAATDRGSDEVPAVFVGVVVVSGETALCPCCVISLVCFLGAPPGGAIADGCMRPVCKSTGRDCWNDAGVPNLFLSLLLQHTFAARPTTRTGTPKGDAEDCRFG
jgi:hypothetical protein